MAPVNRVSLSGHLVAEPQVRVTGYGRWIVHLQLTTEDDVDALVSSETADLIRVVVIDEWLARFAGTRLRQGQRVHIEGQLQTRLASSGHGEPLIMTEIVLFGRRAALVLLDEQEEQLA